MDITKLRSTLLTLGATASVAFAAAAPAAHAQAKDPAGGAGPQGCVLPSGVSVPDGQINTYRRPGMRGSFTCTDGTVCETWTSTYGGRTTWGSDCWDSPSPFVRAPSPKSSRAATAKTKTANAGR